MIKIFCFLKDEIKLVNDWILYHSNLFGLENIYMVDHQSTDGTFECLSKWKSKGLNVFQTNEHFSKKSEILSRIMNRNKEGFLIPIDLDEFIVSFLNNKISCDEKIILETINEKLDTSSALRYKFITFSNIPLEKKAKNVIEECVLFNKEPFHPRSKTFYYSEYFIETDQGNHFGKIKNSNDINSNLYFSGLGLLHYETYDPFHFLKKTIRGAKAYGHDKSPAGNGGNGTHYKNNYWKIMSGSGVAMKKANQNTVKIECLKDKLRDLKSA
jgi:hypothetical protein